MIVNRRLMENLGGSVLDQKSRRSRLRRGGRRAPSGRGSRRRLANALLPEVNDGEPGMVEEHLRPRLPHDCPHGLAPRRQVAVDGAFAARGLGLAVGTSIEPLMGIGEQILARGTRIVPHAVVFGTIQTHHRADRLLLTRDGARLEQRPEREHTSLVRQRRLPGQARAVRSGLHWVHLPLDPATRRLPAPGSAARGTV